MSSFTQFDGRAIPLVRALHTRSPSLYRKLGQVWDKAAIRTSHLRNLIQYLSDIIPDEIPEPLSAFELFSLLCAAMLHEKGRQEAAQHDQKLSPAVIDRINLARKDIIQNHEHLGLTEHEAWIIGEVCRAQDMPDLRYLMGEEFSLNGYGRARIRVPFLSALLRLAHALEVVSPSTSEASAEHRHSLPPSAARSNVSKHITSIKIRTAPSWDIQISVVVDEEISAQQFYKLKNAMQDELDVLYPVLRAAGIFFKRIDLILYRHDESVSDRKLRNPFLLLAPFDARTASRFAGRDKEIQQVVEMVFARKMILIIGESGVGKTSLVEAGVLPELKHYQYKVVRFSFQDSPVGSMARRLGSKLAAGQGTIDLVRIIRRYFQKQKSGTRLLLIGDHLEQMFTIDKSEDTKAQFVQSVSRILGSPFPVTFLFCIREDYLADLYNLSLEIPDLYVRENTFRLHKLDKEHGIQVLKKASRNARWRLSDGLVVRIVDDLCYQGDGMIYPPFLQIVGHRIYAAVGKKYDSERRARVLADRLYDKMGAAEQIVNRYLESLLDQYKDKERLWVGQILSKMVTDHYTKKRITKEALHRSIPECENLDKLLLSLVDRRIVRRSLGEYELMHDFLARRVVEFIEEKRFLSRPVREALKHIKTNFHRHKITSREIALAADVSQMYLSSLFRKEMGSTINKQLNVARIAEAKRLLRTRDRLTSIAKRAGFGSLSAFSRKFKGIESVSPLEYRQAMYESNSRSTIDVDNTYYK
ncbi:MAG TPA: helix-turn-helix domain-containing protein [Sedimentisphaerales bacterium]|nr:helix-turn-helix domain-containing protein [Sedimentisphaerales bacterium]